MPGAAGLAGGLSPVVRRQAVTSSLRAAMPARIAETPPSTRQPNDAFTATRPDHSPPPQRRTPAGPGALISTLPEEPVRAGLSSVSPTRPRRGTQGTACRTAPPALPGCRPPPWPSSPSRAVLTAPPASPATRAATAAPAVTRRPGRAAGPGRGRPGPPARRRRQPGHPGQQAGLPAEAAARRHLDRVGRTFGVRPGDLRTLSVTRVSGRDVVRFQQTRDGLPVLGGQLVTVLDGRGGLLSVSGETARDGRPGTGVRRGGLDRRPHRAPRRGRPARPARVDAGGRPADPLAAGPVAGRAVRDRRRCVRSGGCRCARRRRLDVADLVLVDARSGRVALRLARDRRAGPRRLRRPADRLLPVPGRALRPGRGRSRRPASIDADQAYDLSGATATWYAGALGVDLTALIGSDFGDGRKLRSTTNYCPPGACPLDNAFWTGNQMVYGAGYTSADDVVAHELTHGVTQHTAGLVYWYQSGSINESMSDVLGELVDQGDGIGNDAPEMQVAPRRGPAADGRRGHPRHGRPAPLRPAGHDQQPAVRPRPGLRRQRGRAHQQRRAEQGRPT